MSDSTSPNATILAVDDDVDVLDMLEHIFVRNGYRMLRAFNGRDALRALHSDPSIDIVLLDLLMPVMGGLDVLQEIRADSTLRPIPVLIVTGVVMTAQAIASVGRLSV